MTTVAELPPFVNTTEYANRKPFKAVMARPKLKARMSLAWLQDGSLLGLGICVAFALVFTGLGYAIGHGA